MLQDLLDCLGLGGDAVAYIEAERFPEGVLAEPNTGEGVEEPFVQVICHPAAIMDLTWSADMEEKLGGGFLTTSGELLLNSLTQHVAQAAPVHCSLSVQAVQVVLHKLHAGGEVCLVELVGDIPAEGTILTALLTA